MRFVQTFDKNGEESFLNLEKKFIELERKAPEMKIGKRYVPVIGWEATNTLIWEAEYDSLEEATRSTIAILGLMMIDSMKMVFYVLHPENVE